MELFELKKQQNQIYYSYFPSDLHRGICTTYIIRRPQLNIALLSVCIYL